MENSLKCENCKRSLPNEKHRTKNGCVWCDIQNFYKKMKIKKISILLLGFILIIPSVCWAAGSPYRTLGSSNAYKSNQTTSAPVEEKERNFDVSFDIQVDAACPIKENIYAGVKSDGEKTDIVLFKRWEF